jgi:hypothetical protein
MHGMPWMSAENVEVRKPRRGPEVPARPWPVFSQAAQPPRFWLARKACNLPARKAGNEIEPSLWMASGSGQEMIPLFGASAAGNRTIGTAGRGRGGSAMTEVGMPQTSSLHRKRDTFSQLLVVGMNPFATRPGRLVHQPGKALALQLVPPVVRGSPPCRLVRLRPPLHTSRTPLIVLKGATEGVRKHSLPGGLQGRPIATKLRRRRWRVLAQTENKHAPGYNLS